MSLGVIPGLSTLALKEGRKDGLQRIHEKTCARSEERMQDGQGEKATLVLFSDEIWWRDTESVRQRKRGLIFALRNN